MIKNELKDYILDQLEEQKIEDIIIIDTSKNSSLADCVIIGSGRSGKHIESSMENLKLNMKKDGKNISGMISGIAEDGWIIYDLGNTIVHLFVPAVRDIYRLEQLINPKIKSDIKKPEIEKDIDKKIAPKKSDKKKTITSRVPVKSANKTLKSTSKKTPTKKVTVKKASPKKK